MYMRCARNYTDITAVLFIFVLFWGHFPGGSRESVRTAIIPERSRVSAATGSDPGAKYYDFVFQLQQQTTKIDEVTPNRIGEASPGLNTSVGINYARAVL